MAIKRYSKKPRNFLFFGAKPLMETYKVIPINQEL